MRLRERRVRRLLHASAARLRAADAVAFRLLYASQSLL